MLYTQHDNYIETAVSTRLNNVASDLEDCAHMNEIFVGLFELLLFHQALNIEFLDSLSGPIGPFF